MSVLLTRITVIPMPTAQIQMELSHVLANLALLAPEQIALVGRDPFLFYFYPKFHVDAKFSLCLYIVRCRRVYF